VSLDAVALTPFPVLKVSTVPIVPKVETIEVSVGPSQYAVGLTLTPFLLSLDVSKCNINNNIGN